MNARRDAARRHIAVARLRRRPRLRPLARRTSGAIAGLGASTEPEHRSKAFVVVTLDPPPTAASREDRSRARTARTSSRTCPRAEPTSCDFEKDGYKKSRIAVSRSPGQSTRARPAMLARADAGRARGPARRRGVRRASAPAEMIEASRADVGPADQHTQRATEILEVRRERRGRRAQVRSPGVNVVEGSVRDHPRPRGPLLEHALQRRRRSRARIPTASPSSSTCSPPRS